MVYKLKFITKIIKIMNFFRNFATLKHEGLLNIAIENTILLTWWKE